MQDPAIPDVTVSGNMKLAYDNSPHKSAFIALIGRPNSGKSTLMNSILGEELSIISAMPQTTRNNLKGIYNAPNMQLVFIDTPGMHKGKHISNRRMLSESTEALRDADILCYIVDLSRPSGAEEDSIAKNVANSKTGRIIIFNKKDLCPDYQEVIKSFFLRYPALSSTPFISTDAREKDVAEIFLKAINPFIPAGPAFFPEDDLTDANTRFFAAEYIRGQLIKNTREEVPHAAFVEITEYRELPKQHKIEATIYVESDGQKGIIIGKDGAVIRKIQADAAEDLKKFTGIPATIRCHIKVEPNWRDNDTFLKRVWYKR